MCNNTEEWRKLWRGIDLSFQNWHKKFDKFWLEHSKSSKIYTLMDSFWPKYIMFELKKYRGVIFHDTGKWCKIWRKTELWFEKWLEEFGKFSSEHSKFSKLRLWWNRLIQSKKWITLKFTGNLCAITMTNDAKFEEELTFQFKIDMRNLLNFDDFHPLWQPSALRGNLTMLPRLLHPSKMVFLFPSVLDVSQGSE